MHYSSEELKTLSPGLQLTLKVKLMRLVKKGIDFGAAFFGLILLSPLLVLIGFSVRLDSSGPVLFAAKRVGKHGKEFTMYKFRTMHTDAEIRLAQLSHLNQGGPYMIKIPNDPRVTRLGKFLRRSSLDELPQLWNVLRGEMSLVGPRPQAPNEVALYSPYQRGRLEVLPGITGLWQVTARHSPSFDEWVRLDLEYINNWSLTLDFKILLRTCSVIWHG